MEFILANPKCTNQLGTVKLLFKNLISLSKLSYTHQSVTILRMRHIAKIVCLNLKCLKVFRIVLIHRKLDSNMHENYLLHYNTPKNVNQNYDKTVHLHHRFWQ